ncbi:MAG: carbohydrate ABC transporter permease [Planctomycetota bacterium]
MSDPSVSSISLRAKAFACLAVMANYLVLTVAALLYIAPILFMIVASFKPDDRVLPEAGSWQAFFPSEVTTENYGDVFERVRFGRYMLNSIVITGSIVTGGLVVNSLAAYALARLEWRGRTAVFRIVLALMILPLQAIAVPLFYETTVLGWRDTYVVQIVPFVANAFAIYLFYAFFVGMPRELEEAARIDGAGVWRTLIEVILPNAKPAFAAVAITTFLMYWGLYLWPLMVTTHENVRPLPLAIATFRTLPPLKWGDIMAFAVMMVGPVLVVFIVFQRWFVRGVATSGIKG